MPLLPRRLGKSGIPFDNTGKSDVPLLRQSGGKSGIQYKQRTHQVMPKKLGLQSFCAEIGLHRFAYVPLFDVLDHGARWWQEWHPNMPLLPLGWVSQ